MSNPEVMDSHDRGGEVCEMGRRKGQRGRQRPPSDAAVERLDRSLSEELGGLRESLEDDVVIARVLSAAGEDRALQLLLDRRADHLRDVEERLCRVVADAAVEREAEFVLAGASGGSSSAFRETVRAFALTAAAAVAAVLVVIRPVPSDPGEMVLGSGAADDELRAHYTPRSTDRTATWGWSPTEPSPSPAGVEEDPPVMEADRRSLASAASRDMLNRQAEAGEPADALVRHAERLLHEVDLRLIERREEPPEDETPGPAPSESPSDEDGDATIHGPPASEPEAPAEDDSRDADGPGSEDETRGEGEEEGDEDAGGGRTAPLTGG